MDQSPQGFASEDEEATYCLSLLRDGDRHQKIVARERLSQIFERRGLLDETAQCLESNIREGVRDPRVYQRLAGVYRRQGRHELADEVFVEAQRLAERMARSPQPGARRPVPGRPPGRPGPQTPPPGAMPPGPRPDPLAAPTAQLPAAPRERSAQYAPPSRELGLDELPGGATPASEAPTLTGMAPVGDRPWWLSPAMLVLLILLCGPYGLALMWVRGDYTKSAKQKVSLVWAGLMTLLLAGAAVALQPQMGTIVASVAGSGVVPGIGAAPTPRVFGTPSTPGAGLEKPVLPPGLAASPPTVAASPGSLGAGPAGTTIGPAPSPNVAATAEPTPSPTPVAPPAPEKPSGERVKVADTGGTGANMRERPGSTGPVIKTIPDGEALQIVGSDQEMDGMTWRNVRDDTGTTGWIAAELLEPA